MAIINALPRFIFEVAVIAIILLTIFISYKFSVPEEEIIATITFLTISSLRLVPAFKLILTNLNTIYFYNSSLDLLVNEMNEIKKNVYLYKSINEDNFKEKNLITHNKYIKIQDLSFSYSEESEIVLNKLSFEITKGDKIGLVGTSGSGKTTLINCILGLLKPKNGSIVSDGKNIFDHIESWQNKVGYVPQDIYLLDDTIRKNIAFGEDENLINNEIILDCIRSSNADTFIKNLSKGIETIVGNRGTRISGGQKQRIGIARALYTKPEILILDEATNALDASNEKEIIQEIFNENIDTTIFLIAHRISSLENCNKIIFLENGKIKDIGNYKDIINRYSLI